MRAFHVAAVALPLLLGAGAAMAESGDRHGGKRRPGRQDGGDQRPALHARGPSVRAEDRQIKVGDKVTVQFDVNTNNVYQIDHAK